MVVSVREAKSYQEEEVRAAVHRLFEDLGGAGRFIKPGEKVLLKVNLLIRKRPEEACTTHPAVVEAVAREFLEAGAEVIIADSPGGVYNASLLKAIYKTTGMEAVAERTGASLNLDTSFQEIETEAGKARRSFPVIKPVLDADFVVSMAKLKTHGMTGYTGAVKNLFGVIPGTFKAEYHFRYPSLTPFCEMLLDLSEHIKPGLSIMDGIVGMEGPGPSGGSPREVGLLFASESPYLLDAVAARVIGFHTSEVEPLRLAALRGLMPEKAEEIETVGDPWQAHVISDYKRADEKSVSFLRYVPGVFRPIAERVTSSKPVFLKEKCVRCGQCQMHCPPKAITMGREVPAIDFNKCIKCYCCQELCPHRAVELKRPRLFRWVH